MKRILFCLFLILNVLPAFAQQMGNEWLSELKQRFQEYASRQPETIYLHTDRTVYATADTVWFKAYLADAKTHALHPVPEIIYLDLVSEKGRLILSQRLKTENGFKAGSLTLPDTLKTGNYLIQVYTNWQRNIGSKAYSRQPLYVNKVPQNLTKTVENAAPNVPATIQFYPEGGKLLAGFESRVGFKATSANGEILRFEGRIIDETGKLITTIRSQQAGIGSFLLRPQAGQTYRAQILAGGGKLEFPLPGIEKGYGLSLKNSPDSVTVNLAATEVTGTPVYLVLQCQGRLLSADSVRFNANGFRKINLQATTWPEGIIQVSLLNANQKVESERLFYHSKNQLLKVSLVTTKKAYSRREPVELAVSVTDASGKPVLTTLSVAVTNSLPTIAVPLKNTLQLGSEISDYQLLASADEQNYNDVLLTQTNPDFSWEAFAAYKKEAPAFQRETELSLPAMATENNAAIGNAVIYLLETNSGKTHLATSNAEGRFRVPLEGSRFFYQVWQNGVWRKQAQLQLLSVENVAAVANQIPVIPTDSASTRQFTLRRQIDMMYDPDGATATPILINKEMWPSYAADKHYPLAEYNELTNMEEILREMVPEVRVVTRKKQVQANVYDNDRRIFFPHQPLYIIDGQPTWNNDLFLRLDASQLEQVNIYNSDKTLKNFGFMGNQGVIVVFTKSRNYQNPDLSRENILKVPGQFENTHFKPVAKPANVPDFRPTLYWNPLVQTNAEGKAILNFQTTDEMGALKVNVQGITQDGQLISEELIIPVKPAN